MSLWGREIDLPGDSSRQRHARAIALAMDLIENGRMMAMGRGPFVYAIRPKTLRVRDERVQLTYSEPDHLAKFDWGVDALGADDWAVWLDDPERTVVYDQFRRRTMPKIIRS